VCRVPEPPVLEVDGPSVLERDDPPEVNGAMSTLWVCAPAELVFGTEWVWAPSVDVFVVCLAPRLTPGAEESTWKNARTVPFSGTAWLWLPAEPVLPMLCV